MQYHPDQEQVNEPTLTPESVGPQEAPQEVAPAEPTAEEALAEQLATLKQDFLRALAEAENIRKRCQRDVEDAANYAISKFATDLLGVADNLQRALAALASTPLEEAGPLAPVMEGVKLTQSELDRVLRKHGLVVINPLGEKFDHNYHQAIFETPIPGVEPGTVVEVVQVGYVLNQRLLRPAMVGVARLPS